MRKLKSVKISLLAFVLVALAAGCGREQTPSPAFPKVIATSPANGATLVLLNTAVTAVFTMTAGGGLDYRLNHRLALRLFQAEYLLTRFDNPTSPTNATGWQSNMRLSAGVVFRFWGKSRASTAAAQSSASNFLLGRQDFGLRGIGRLRHGACRR